MSFETAAEPWIRPQLGRHDALERERAARPPAPENERSAARARHAGGNRVFDVGPGADHPTEQAELGFADLLDVINPLQHIPVVSSLYRQISGDEIEAPARILGGTLYGGPLGFVYATSNALVAEVGGDDLGGQVLAQLFGSPDDATGAATAVAQAPRPEPTPGSQPELAAEALTGESALDALYRDMTGRSRRGDQATGPSLQAPQAVAAKIVEGPKGRAFPIRPQDRQVTSYRAVSVPSPIQAAATAPALTAPAAGAPLDAGSGAQSFFTDQMLVGLEKYEALSKPKGELNGATLDLGL
jgi:hypothetical protein